MAWRQWALQKSKKNRTLSRPTNTPRSRSGSNRPVRGKWPRRRQYTNSNWSWSPRYCSRNSGWQWLSRVKFWAWRRKVFQRWLKLQWCWVHQRTRCRQWWRTKLSPRGGHRSRSWNHLCRWRCRPWRYRCNRTNRHTNWCTRGTRRSCRWRQRRQRSRMHIKPKWATIGRTNCWNSGLYRCRIRYRTSSWSMPD